MSMNIPLSRRHMLMTAAATSGAALLSWPAELYATLAQKAFDPRVQKIIESAISVDMHNHIGQPVFAGASASNPAAPIAPDAAGIDLPGQIRKSGLSAVCLTSFVDLYLTPKPGDWYDYHLQIYDYVDKLLSMSGLRRALTMADLEAAHTARTPIVIQSSEGVQWIEGKLERIEESYARGLRHLQLFHQMHDLEDPLGGIQQAIKADHASSHAAVDPASGLTAFGAQVITQCNRLGIVVDMAHGDEKTVLGGLKIARQPMVVSHTALDTEVARSADIYTGNPGLRGRLVSTTYAKAVADEGGIIGIWRIFPTMKAYVTGIRQMVDVVGVDHTGIGTDTVIAPPPAGSAISARQPATNAIWPEQQGGFLFSLVDEMLTQGFAADEIRKIIGGNYCRVFKAVTSGHAKAA